MSGAVHTPGTLAELISPSGVCDEEQHLLALGIWAKKNAPALQAHADALCAALEAIERHCDARDLGAVRGMARQALAAYQATKP